MPRAQVVNDLLDETRTNLRMREDPARGFYAEGLTEVTLVSAAHALDCIAAGNAQRKVRPAPRAAGAAEPRRCVARHVCSCFACLGPRLCVDEESLEMRGLGGCEISLFGMRLVRDMPGHALITVCPILLQAVSTSHRTGFSEPALRGAPDLQPCPQTSATALNEGSSRSHTVLRVSIESAPSASADGACGSGATTVSALHLIDLAGSESARVRHPWRPRGERHRRRLHVGGAHHGVAVGASCVKQLQASTHCYQPWWTQMVRHASGHQQCEVYVRPIGKKLSGDPYVAFIGQACYGSASRKTVSDSRMPSAPMLKHHCGKLGLKARRPPGGGDALAHQGGQLHQPLAAGAGLCDRQAQRGRRGTRALP